MASLKILIVEDVAIAANDLKEMLEEADYEVTGIARNYNEAISLVKMNPPDMALLDIELKGSTQDGIETARAINLINRIPVIYITSHTEFPYFQEAKETFPAAYLLKPYKKQELILQVELAHNNFNHAQSSTTGNYESDSLFIKIRDGYERIYKKDILYLKADGMYTHIYVTGSTSSLTVAIGLGNLVHYLFENNFFRLSRSLLINLNFAKRLDGDFIYLKDTAKPFTIPIAIKKDLMKKLNVIRSI